MSEKTEHQDAAKEKLDLGRDYVGDTLTAICAEITDDRIMIAFGEDEHGFIPANEFTEIPKIGDEIECYIDGVARNGFWRASIEKLAYEKLWKQLNQWRDDQSDVEVEVVSAENNGLVCDLASMMAFMPKRQINLRLESNDLSTYVGQKMLARILKLSHKDASIIISHRAAIEQSLLEAREVLLASLQVGQVFDGIVSQVVAYGAFVDIGSGVEGLVHRSNLSWQNVEPSEIISNGDTLKVTVLDIEQGKISLGHKQLVEDTWATSIKEMKVGEIYDAKVTTLANFGAFVVLDNKLEGLVHNSELSWNASIHHAKQVLAINESIKLKLIGIDEGRRRLKLSFKRVQENPWKLAAETYPQGQKVKLTIVGIADFGLFVDMGNDLRGLIHISDLQWSGRTNNLQESYKVGDEIECVALSVDTENARASFGVKQLVQDPWLEFQERAPLGKRFEATIKRITNFGAFAALDDDVEGLIHISEMSPNRLSEVTEVVNVGDKVEVTVINIDIPRRRIGLSMTAEPFDVSESESNEQAQDEDNEENSQSSRATLADVLPKGLLHKL